MSTPAREVTASLNNGRSLVGEQKFSLTTLTAMVVGSMVGAGIFSLPSAFGRATGPFGALIAWGIAGAGMLMLAFVFQTLAQRKPDLDAGVYAYAKAGFGHYPGFLSALGYWTGTAIGNVTYFIVIKSTLGIFFPVFGDGNTIPAVAVSSLILWAVHFMILRGVKEAAGINTVVTVAKILPIIMFIVLVALAFRSEFFMDNFWGGGEYSFNDIFEQVRSTMLVTVFVFLGIEGASVYSRYARKREDVGAATLMGFVGVLCLLVLVTVLSYGVLPRTELGALRNPSMAGVLEAVVGRWGAIFVSVGLIISVLGAYLSWSLLAAEVAYTAATTRDMPAFLAHENENKVPSTALWVTNGLVQFFLIITLFSQEAFTFFLKLASAMNLIPYLLVAAFALLISWRGETYEKAPEDRRGDLIRAILATIYTAFLLWAGGMKFLLLSTVIYGPGTLLFFMARREQGLAVFTRPEWALFVVAIAGAVAALYGLATGRITI
jgi:arginine:ornithine antiporter/lysine permease